MIKKNKIILLLFLISIILLIFGVVIIYKDKNNTQKIINAVQEKLNIIVSGNSLEANFEFDDNYSNKLISKSYLNMENEELLEKGYVEYIQSSDYMIKFYSKILVKQINIKEQKEDEIVCLIKVKRPNLMEIMDECDKENIDNEAYNFNSAFIDKIETNDFEYYEGTFEIIIKKINGQFKFKYDDNFKALLYG